MEKNIKDRKTFGRLIRDSGVSVSELVRLTGITSHTIYGYMGGHSFTRKLEILETICEKCGIDIYSLDLASLVDPKYIKNFTKYTGQDINSEPTVDKPDGETRAVMQNHNESGFPGYTIYDGKEGVIIGKSDSIKYVFTLLDQITRNPDQDSVVLIQGETGTGKELVARAVHYNGERSQSSYIGINITSVDNDLIESELFGHRKGAFTGAVDEKKGFLEEVGEGTLLIDEIASLSRQAQVKLLRVLQERFFYRVGDTKQIRFKGRIVVTTNGDLEELVKSGSFREDLFYRMNVISLIIPPLRERREDITDLFSYFVCMYNKRYGTNFNLEPTQDGLGFLLSHSFPGNVRELENLVKKAIFISRDDYVRIEDCNNGIATKTQHDGSNGKRDTKHVFVDEVKSMVPYETMNTIQRVKLETILRTYFDCYGNNVITARRLGYSGGSGSGLREYFRNLGIGLRVVKLAYLRTHNINGI